MQPKYVAAIGFATIKLCVDTTCSTGTKGMSDLKVKRHTTLGRETKPVNVVLCLSLHFYFYYFYKF